MRTLNQHCQGSCAGQTNEVTIITDSWNDDVASKWNTNIQTLSQRDGVRFEINIICGDEVASLNF